VKVKIFSACFSRTETTCETTSLFQLGGSIKKEFMSAHYIDIHIRLCVCVCLSVCLRGYLWNHAQAQPLPIFFLCMLPMAVARSSAGRVTKFQGKGNFGGFPPH